MPDSEKWQKPQGQVEELVETANANGGRDNISVIVIEPLADGDSYENHMKMLRNEVEHD